MRDTAQYQKMADDGMTYNEIAAELGISWGNAKKRLNRRGIYPKKEAEKTLRDKVQDMRPMDAVEFLLGVIDELSLVAPDPEHPVVSWGVTRPMLIRLATALYDFQGKMLTKEACYNAMCFDRVDAADLPDMKVVDVQICNLRKCLPDHVKIETAWGRGYRMVVSE